MSFGEGWHPVALANDLEPGHSAGTRLFDRELCIWRDADGRPHAWEDRCPHRGMRLSFGFVRGDRIACLYHGWQYDTHGQCRLIPAHPDLDVPSTIRVVTYPCVERLGMLWVYSDVTSEPPPDLTIQQAEVVAVRSLYIDCAPAAVLDFLAKTSTDIGSAGVALLSIDAGGQNLIVGVQPFGKAKVALHIVIPGSADKHSPAARTAAAIWAEELRRDLEQKSDSSAAPIFAEAAP
jgi:nitrite reductase/ring-hydroxylating ferredoxin subunit